MTDLGPVGLVADALARIIREYPAADVVDVGGGSGTRAVPLAQAGCRVLVVDNSTDALASLGRRAAEAGVSDRVSALQADADDLGTEVPEASADLVLYHHVVEAVDDPERALAAAARVLRPGGWLSIVVPGRLSAAVAYALAGRYEAASQLLAGGLHATGEQPATGARKRSGTDRRGDAGHAEGPGGRMYEVPGLSALVEGAGLVVESVVGVGIVTALAGGHGRLADDPELARLEEEFGRHPVLGQLAGDLHAIGLRPA